MSKKKLLASALYVLAVLGPAAALVLRFGMDTNVSLKDSAETAEQLLSIGGALVAGFTVSVFASRLLASEVDSLLSLAKSIFSDLQDQVRHPRRT